MLVNNQNTEQGINKSPSYELEKVYTISISEKDCSNRIKPVVLFNYMQDLAAKSITNIGYKYSCEGLAEVGRGWFIIRYSVDFCGDLSNVQEIKIKTESRGCQKSTFYRTFEIYNSKTEELLLRAISTWFIVDMESKSLVNIGKEYPDFRKFEKKDDDLVFQRLKSLDCSNREECFNIRYDDLDINKHVNNTAYISWALETLDYDFRQNNILKSMDIYYKHEAQYGESILSKVNIDTQQKLSEHAIINASTGDELCLLKISYK